MLEAELRQRLVEAALAAREEAYAPYSEFLVGAAVLDVGGKVTLGANVENAAYGLSLCAEQVAVGAAVAAGARQLVAVAVASVGGVTPCGACRQVLAEFGAEMEVVLLDVDAADDWRVMTLKELLPERFGRGDL